MNKGKLIDADKLKEKIQDKLGYTYALFNIIDELSEEREDVIEVPDIRNKLGSIVTLIQLSEDEKVSSVIFQQCRETAKKAVNYLAKREVFKYELQQPNTLKIAIKLDGTEEYGKKIIEYFNKIGTNYLKVCGVNGNRYYYLDGEKDLWFSDSLPEGYTEISLKEESWIDKDKRLFPTLESRVEIIEQKLKDLSK